nr:unnamed protein product [Callosobruchus analis]
MLVVKVAGLVFMNSSTCFLEGFKMLRRILRDSWNVMPPPIAFDVLKNLYDESCLIENPYFYVAEMECWPCENVNTVVDITENKDLFKSGAGTPFVAKSNQEKVSLKTLEKLYNANKAILEPEAYKIKSSSTEIHHFEDLFRKEIPSEAHISWRMNKMNLARVIRKVFQRPYFLPDRVGQSVERFLLIDGPTAVPYELPNTECGYVFVLQGSGERTIVLKPSRECIGKCKTVSVVLKDSHVCKYQISSCPVHTSVPRKVHLLIQI